MALETYDELRRSLFHVDPRLCKSVFCAPDPPKEVWTPWLRGKSRVLALRVGERETFDAPVEYVDPAALATHLQQSSVLHKEPSRFVYILEGLSRQFLEVLGGHFQIHPTTFMDHERFVPCGDRITGENGGLPILPSAIRGREHVAFKYHEPLVLSRCPTGFRCLCDVSGRHIAVTRLLGKFSEVGICRRKCTFWSRASVSGGWTCLIICDPPVRRYLTDYSGQHSQSIDTKPYSSGYIDFRPLADQIVARKGPMRMSMLQDLLFYLQNYSNALDLKEHMSPRAIIEKIVAGHYLKLAELLQTNVEIVQWHLSRRQDLTSFAVSTAEELWSDVQAWERRAAEYQDDIEAIMLQLSIPLLPSQGVGAVSSMSDSAIDFQHLMSRYREIRQRVHALAGAVMALASLAGNRTNFTVAELSLKEAERAGREARSVRALTILGIVFLPLSFSASLFSMADSYIPGGSMFWVYFVVSTPLLALVILVYSITELGFEAGAKRWSLGVVIANARRALKSK